MRILIFFDGDGCVSKAAKALGHDVRCLDILPLPHIDYVMDILDFKSELTGGWIPDAIWASPPCETFSCITNMKGCGNRYYETTKQYGHVQSITPRTDFTIDKRLIGFDETITKKGAEHRLFVDKTIEIIDDYEKVNPDLLWCIENPASGLIRYYLMTLKVGINENRTTYCMYGKPYRKETSIFSNIELELKWCHKHRKGVVDDCGGHSDSFAQRYDKKRQPKGVVSRSTYLDRSSIPEALCVEILNQLQNEYSLWDEE
jgi:hypothetical protein